VEEGGGRVLDQETLEILINKFAFGGIGFGTAIFEKFVDFGALITGDIGVLGRMPKLILIGIFGDLLSNKKGLEVVGIGNIGDFYFDGKSELLPGITDLFGEVDKSGSSSKFELEVGVDVGEEFLGGFERIEVGFDFGIESPGIGGNGTEGTSVIGGLVGNGVGEGLTNRLVGHVFIRILGIKEDDG